MASAHYSVIPRLIIRYSCRIILLPDCKLGVTLAANQIAPAPRARNFEAVTITTPSGPLHLAQEPEFSSSLQIRASRQGVRHTLLSMVYYFTSNVVSPAAFIYVGKDKVESTSPRINDLRSLPIPPKRY